VPHPLPPRDCDHSPLADPDVRSGNLSTTTSLGWSAGLPLGRPPGRWIWKRFRPPGGRKRIHIHLPRGLPEGSPADHPNEVVVDIFPLRRMSSWRSTTMALAYEWAGNVLHNFRKRSLLLPSPSLILLVFGRFPAELGPETRSNGSGSTNDAERTQN
jgi:hypothetical protein